MRKLLLLSSLLFHFIYYSAQTTLKYCGTDELRIETAKQNSKIANAVIERNKQLEHYTKQYVNDFYAGKKRLSVYTIPVVFHVIHNFGNENISDAQILDGLNVLNKTFRKQLADTASIVAAFKPIHADCEIEFQLATKDPNGICTNGINRIASTLTTIGDHSVKSLIQWPPNKYLNIYVVANAAGLAGHCLFPSDADTIPAWDGIVIGHDYLGSIGTSNSLKSVVLAHECGHYLNLQHIWGGNNVPGYYYYPCADPNKDCNIDDLVADTPPTIGWQNCNLSGASCGNIVDNVQNAMDYSYCNKMFTVGQKARMHACLNSPIAGRNNLWQPANLIATGIINPDTSLCKADFKSSTQVVCQNFTTPITFTNISYQPNFTSVEWTFQGGNPTTSTATAPTILYASPGVYDVTLKVKKANDSMVVTKTKFIKVLQTTAATYPFSEGFETNPPLTGLDWFENSFDTINNWQVTNTAAYTGNYSVMLKNYNASQGTKDELISKLFNLNGASSMSINFKYAYAKKDTSSNDRLQVYISNNCNSTWLQRLNLASNTLVTSSNQSTSFTPVSQTEWKNTSVTIPTSYLTTNFRFKFVFTSSNGNNIYIDDINLASAIGIDETSEIEKTLIVYPNPATENINISFYLKKTENISISLINILGQNILELDEKKYSEGNNHIVLNTSRINAGYYFISISNGIDFFQKPVMIYK